MQSETIIGSSTDRITCVTNAINQAIKKASPKAQAVHIIIASVIKTNKNWQNIVKIIREPDRDVIYKPAIIFVHLPNKYHDLYDDLLGMNEVDHINVIDDESIWNNITAYLLDIIFYQAVHFNKLVAISSSGDGYLKEKNNLNKNLKINTLELNLDTDKLNDKHMMNKLYDKNFYEKIEEVTLESKEDEHYFFYQKINGLTPYDKLLKTLKYSFK